MGLLDYKQVRIKHPLKEDLPICTSGGTGIGYSVNQIKNACKGAKVKAGLTANDVSGKRIKKWLKKNKAVS
ncbi:MAG: hypothetical protein LUH14_04370 [Clostridiaceae bacterium]|nr:hypothetical protein [Clostridiaceae bacterium]